MDDKNTKKYTKTPRRHTTQMKYTQTHIHIKYAETIDYYKQLKANKTKQKCRYLPRKITIFAVEPIRNKNKEGKGRRNRVR
jgi:hypothetical protein